MSSVIEGYSYDIFISYRQKDNKGDRWVSEFVEALRTELESTFKEEISVYFDINPHDGLLETHDVDESLKDKLKCLIFIPVISRTYCDPKSFAWQHEFLKFIELASTDRYGLKVRLHSGNVASRILPVRIHELDPGDTKLCENEIGGVLRGVEFIYKSAGVNRPLRRDEDSPKENLDHTFYRDQINKVANAVREIVEGLKGDSFYEKKDAVPVYPAVEKFQVIKRFSHKNLKKVILALIIITGIAVAVFFVSRSGTFSPGKTIAFIPLRIYGEGTLVNDASNFAEAVNDKLQSVRSLSKVSAVSMLQYANTEKPLDVIRKELRSDYFISGNIRRESGKVLIWVELSDARKNKSLWSERYVWNKAAIPLITKEIVFRVADALDLKLDDEEMNEIKSEITGDSSASLNYISANAIVNDATFYFYYGNKLRDSISFISAIQWYDKAIASDPSFAEAYARRSLAISWGVYTSQVDSSFIGQCISDADKALSLKRNLPEGHIAKGFYYYYCRKNEMQKALDHFRIAAELNSDDYHPLFYMALVLRRMGEWDQSMNLIRKVIGFNPTEALFLTNIGLSYQYTHNYDSAILFHQKAIDIMPEWPDAYLNKLNCALLRDGKTDDAWSILEMAKAKTDRNLETMSLILYLFDEKYADALNIADSLPQESAVTGEKNLYLGMIYDGLKQEKIAKVHFDSAVVKFSRFVSSYPDNAGLRVRLAVAYSGAGNNKKALDEIRKAVRLSAGNDMQVSDMKIYYAQILIESGEYTEALKVIDELLQSPSELSMRSLLTDPVYQKLRLQKEFNQIAGKYTSK